MQIVLLSFFLQLLLLLLLSLVRQSDPLKKVAVNCGAEQANDLEAASFVIIHHQEKHSK